jgi:hypothetical protein
MSENRLELKRRQIKQQHGNSEVTSLLETFKGNSPKICFIGFVIADQLSNAWIAGLLLELGLLLHCNRFLSPGLP